MMRKTYKAIVTIKETNKSYETDAIRVNNRWIIGGDKPEYDKKYYSLLVYINDEFFAQYQLKNGRMIRS